MTTTAKIIHYNGKQLWLVPDESLDREIAQKQVESIEIRLNDGRQISNEQRRKIFAIIRDISLWSGHEPEYLRMYLTWEFMGISGSGLFSLEDVDMTTARKFITYLIGFCFDNDVPTKKPLLSQTDDNYDYLYLCLEHRKCAVCNKKNAEVHHVDRIGMGRDREQIVHVGLRAIALCPGLDGHHEEAHRDQKKLFEQNFVYGIKLDEYLCKRLSLNTEKRT